MSVTRALVRGHLEKGRSEVETYAKDRMGWIQSFNHTMITGGEFRQPHILLQNLCVTSIVLENSQ